LVPSIYRFCFPPIVPIGHCILFMGRPMLHFARFAASFVDVRNLLTTRRGLLHGASSFIVAHARERERPCWTSVCAVLLFLVAGCADENAYPNRPITLVCPWGIGGGTDQIARQMAIHLEQELGQPVNVINRTGGQGVNGHIRGLKADADGYTLAMITVELNMFHWNRLADLTYRDALPLISVNEDPAAIFVHAESPWHTLDDLAQHIRSSSDNKVRFSGTSAGGIWHLAAVGWLQTMGLPADAITWVASQGAGPALQDMLPNSVVCCSLPEARIPLREGRVRCLGVMADRRQPAPFDQVPTLKEQGYDWTLYGWRGFAFPQGTPEAAVRRMTEALVKVAQGQTRVAGETFPDFMQFAGFNLTVREGDAFGEFLAAQDEQLGRTIEEGQFSKVAQGAISPMLFPYILFGLLGCSLLGMLWKTFSEEEVEPKPLDQQSSPNQFYFMLVPGAVAAYAFLAPMAGFLMVTAAILLTLLYCYGTRLWLSAVIALLGAAVLYHTFAHGMRVSLPRGWYGW